MAARLLLAAPLLAGHVWGCLRDGCGRSASAGVSLLGLTHEPAHHAAGDAARRRLLQDGLPTEANADYAEDFRRLNPKEALSFLCPGVDFENGTLMCMNQEPLQMSANLEDGYYFDIPQSPDGSNMAVDIRLESVVGNANLEIKASQDRIFGKRSVFASIDDQLYIGKREVSPGSQILLVIEAEVHAVYRLHIQFNTATKRVQDQDRAIVQEVLKDCCQHGCDASFEQAVNNSDDHGMCGEGGAFPFWYCDQQGFLVHVNLKALNLRCNVTGLAALGALDHLESLELGYSPGLSGELADLGAIFRQTTTLQHLRMKDLPNIQGGLEDLCNTEIRELHVTGRKTAPTLSGGYPFCIFRNLHVLHLHNTGVTGPLEVPVGSPLQEINIYQGSLPKDMRARGGDIDLAEAASLQSVALTQLEYNGTLGVGYGVRWLHVKAVPLQKVKLASAGELTSIILYETNVQNAVLEMLSDAAKLEYLHISGGRLQTLPSNWNVPALQQLKADYTGLQGELPKSLAQQPSLVHLMLTRNSLSGTLDDFARALPETTKLAHLDMSYNQLTGKLPGALARMSTYTHWTSTKSEFAHVVNVSNNQLEGAVPQDLLQNARVDAVLHLDISNTGVECPNPASMETYTVHCNRFPTSHQHAIPHEDATPAGAPRQRRGKSLWAAIGVSFGVTAVVVAVAAAVVHYRRRGARLDFGRVGHYYADVPSQPGAAMPGNVQLEPVGLDGY